MPAGLCIAVGSLRTLRLDGASARDDVEIMAASSSSPAPRRVVIAGGGLAGLSLALALKTALRDALDVTLCDPALQRDPTGDKRAFAIAAAARRMLQALDIWPGLEAEAQPVVDMVITDSRLHDPVRPAFLTFGGEASAGEPFAHMVESGAVTSALIEGCRKAGVILRAAGIDRLSNEPDAVRVTVAGEGPIAADLLVAADGARSRLREQAGISWISWPYDQSGIVA